MPDVFKRLISRVMIPGPYADLRGTFAPSRRASERPIAIACLRLLTFLPEPPDLSVPAFILWTARFTLFEALGPYLLPPDLVAIVTFLFQWPDSGIVRFVPVKLRSFGI
jgi:hypothetical protein